MLREYSGCTSTSILSAVQHIAKDLFTLIVYSGNLIILRAFFIILLGPKRI